MGRAKEIIVKVINSKVANGFVKKNHYSGKVVQNSKLHFGCFLDGKLHGVLSYGSPLSKKLVLNLVKPSLWNEMLELNRMAFDDFLPKFSESRCIAISIRLIKKNAPQIKWILSFSDSTQCGDGTIYRASGFELTSIKKNVGSYLFPNNKVYNIVGLRSTRTGDNCIRTKLGAGKNEKTSAFIKRVGAKLLKGFQLRYIYLIDKTCKITVPILEFSEIDKQGAGMYKGKKITLQERKVIHLSAEVESNANS